MQGRWPINVFRGLPADGRIRASAIDGEIVLDAPGNSNDIHMAVHADGFAPWMSFLPSRGELPLRPGPLVNVMSDPDVCALGLAQLDHVHNRSGQPCFNAPEAVRASARDRIGDLGLQLERILIPRTQRFDAAERKNWTRQLKAAAMEGPLLVRKAGSHDGSGLARCADIEAARQAMSRLAPQESAYVSEFADFGIEARFSKLRLAFISGEIIPRHCLQSDHWNIHAQKRTENDVESELAYMALIEDQVRGGEFGDIAKIADALGLDYFGLDLGVLKDGRFILFEANASMRILDVTASHAERFEPYVRRIGQALLATLREPEGWRNRKPEEATG